MSSSNDARPAARRAHRGRTGFTTGACSAAAARAATLGLFAGQVPERVETLLPNGQRVTFAVAEQRVEADAVTAVVVKDAGDDPDVTDKARLTATVRRLATPGVVLKGGAGVGVVTRPGIGLPVGEAAINPVPRRNIAENVREALLSLGLDPDAHGIEITISVPDGEKMAQRTLNPRLGILGGISILGTTGIVRPYSTAAFRASVVQAIHAAAAAGADTVVLTTGGRSEKAMMQHLPQLPEVAFVQMGDFVRTAFEAARTAGIRTVVVGAMVGKLTKMAQGMPVTHAGKGEVDRTILAQCAAEIGAPPQVVAEIASALTARFAAERLAELGLAAAFHRALALRAWCVLKDKYWRSAQRQLVVAVMDFEGRILAEVAARDLEACTHTAMGTNDLETRVLCNTAQAESLPPAKPVGDGR